MIYDTYIRAAHPDDAGKLARIHLDCWRTTYQGLIPCSYLERMRDDRTTRTMQRGLADPDNRCLIAETTLREVVGYISAGPERTRDPIYQGEIYELYVDPAFQRHGLGKRLLSAMAHQLYRENVFTIMVWVLAGNPNRRFYEKRNGIYLHTRMIELAGTKLEAAAYGWIDITLAMTGNLFYR